MPHTPSLNEILCNYRDILLIFSYEQPSTRTATSNGLVEVNSPLTHTLAYYT